VLYSVSDAIEPHEGSRVDQHLQFSIVEQLKESGCSVIEELGERLILKTSY
jgi:hypothetical protein